MNQFARACRVASGILQRLQVSIEIVEEFFVCLAALSQNGNAKGGPEENKVS